MRPVVAVVNVNRGNNGGQRGRNVTTKHKVVDVEIPRPQDNSPAPVGWENKRIARFIGLTNDSLAIAIKTPGIRDDRVAHRLNTLIPKGGNRQKVSHVICPYPTTE